MKKLFIFLFAGLLFSCQSEEIPLDDQNDLQKVTYSNVEDLISEMKSNANLNQSTISFEVIRDGNNFEVVDVKNMEFVDDFVKGFNNSSEKRYLGDVVVYCDYSGTTPTSVTNCPAGPNQGSCVGSATIQCLNGGGCSTSCETRTIITVTPTKNTDGSFQSI